MGISVPRIFGDLKSWGRVCLGSHDNSEPYWIPGGTLYQPHPQFGSSGTVTPGGVKDATAEHAGQLESPAEF